MKRELKKDFGVALREGDVDKQNEIAEKLLNIGNVSDMLLEKEVPWRDRQIMKTSPGDMLQEELLQ